MPKTNLHRQPNDFEIDEAVLLSENVRCKFGIYADTA